MVVLCPYMKSILQSQLFEINPTGKISDVTVYPCVLAFAILLMMSIHLLSKAKLGLIPRLCVSTDAVGIAWEPEHDQNQLEHRCRRCTLIVDVRLATRLPKHVEWSRQAGRD